MNCLRPYQNDILDRTRTAYRDGYKAPCIVSPCGSGKSVMVAEMAKCATEKGNRVLFLVHRKELCDQIESTFKWWGVDMSLCDVSMVQTVCRRLDKIPEPGLIITDENHHCRAKSYEKVYNKFPHVSRIGVTATPVRLDGKGLDGVNDILIQGPTVKELIEWGNLSDFKYFAVSNIDFSKMKTRGGEYKYEEVDGKMKTNEHVIRGDVIKNYKRLSDGKQAIVYCHSIWMSEAIVDEFNKFNIAAKHIDGNTPKKERDCIVEQFKNGEITILSNVDIISEGFDVPDCNTAILLRPTKSESLYIQQAMRCMRPKEGKTAIIIDHVGNVHEFGLPDREREWSLDGKTGKNGGCNDPLEKEDDIKIRVCLLCFQVIDQLVRICPHCGAELGEKVVKYEESNERIAELVEIDRNYSITLDYRKPSDCKNMTELQELAKNRGYKPGWAWYQGKALGFVR